MSLALKIKPALPCRPRFVIIWVHNSSLATTIALARNHGALFERSFVAPSPLFRVLDQ